MKRFLMLSSLFYNISNLLLADVSCYVAEASKHWEDSDAAKSNWSGNCNPDSGDDVVFDYWEFCAHLPADTILFDIKFSAPETKKVRSLTIRNFFDKEKYVPIHGVFRSMKPNQKLEIEENFVRELNVCDGEFHFGVTGCDSSAADAQMQIEIGKNLLVGTPDMNPLFKGALVFGGNGNFAQNARRGPEKVLVKGNVGIYGAGELHLNVGAEGTLTDADRDDLFEVCGNVEMISMDTHYPLWILNCRNRKLMSKSNPLNAIIKIGGLVGNGLIKNNTGELGGTSTIVFANPKATVSIFNGQIQDDDVVGGNSKVRIVMDGDGIQYLSKAMGAKRFTGGIAVERGIIFMNATMPVGDAVLNGGFIGATGREIESVGVLCVNDIKFSGGSIISILGNDSKASMIDVRGDLTFDENVKFKFVLKSYVLAGKYKVLQWRKKPNLENVKFISDDLGTIRPVFDIADDGVYVRFVKR